jgi:hypothetical protein
MDAVRSRFEEEPADERTVFDDAGHAENHAALQTTWESVLRTQRTLR